MNKETKEKGLKWWQLTLLGVAGTIGTGYFLGSSLTISIGGPSVLLAYVLAGIGTYMVFDALSTVVGTLFHPISRPGFLISLLLVSIIVVCDLIVHKVRKRHTK